MDKYFHFDLATVSREGLGLEEQEGPRDGFARILWGECLDMFDVLVDGSGMFPVLLRGVEEQDLELADVRRANFGVRIAADLFLLIVPVIESVRCFLDPRGAGADPSRQVEHRHELAKCHVVS